MTGQLPSKDVASDLRAALELLDGRSNYNPSGSRRSTILTNKIHNSIEATMRRAADEIEQLRRDVLLLEIVGREQEQRIAELKRAAQPPGDGWDANGSPVTE